MRKVKKKIAVRRTRSASGSCRCAPGHRLVKLTRAHLEMSGRLTDDEDKRYALTALCVRRVGDAAVVEATNGRMAWQYPAELVDGGELPETFAGKELADGERVLIDPSTAKQCLRALPTKSAPRESWKNAYLAVDGGVGVLYTVSGVSFRLAHHYDADAKWPDFNEGEYVPGRQPLCVGLDAAELYKITTWLSKHVCGDGRQALVISFSRAGSVIHVGFDVNREGGPVGTLMPFRIDGDPLSKAMPMWEAAFEKEGEGA